MDDEKITLVRDEVQKGMDAIAAGNNDLGSRHFWTATDILATIQDDSKKRDEMSSLAYIFTRYGFHDLALIEASELVVIDEKLGNNRNLAEDLLALGNANTNLGQADKAEENYNRALKICLKKGYYSNAASASTNIAGIKAEQNKMDDAIALLRKSLEFLEKEPFPETERNTLLTLIQVLGITDKYPEELIESAKRLFKKFQNEITPKYIKVISPYIDNAVKKFLGQNPAINPLQWKAMNLPQIYGNKL